MPYKKIKKINFVPRFFLTLLLFAISLQAASLLFLTLSPAPAQAAPKPLEMNLQVPIPGLNSHIVFGPNTGKIAEYIKAIYNYAIGIVGILAAVVIMIGGLMWITAGGNKSNIGEAKTMITASLTGLVLVLTSYLILSMVNPALVNLQSSVIGRVDSTPGSALTNKTCSWTAVKEMLKNSGSAQYSVTQSCEEAKNDGKKWDEIQEACEGTAKNGEICCCPRPTGCSDCKDIISAGFYAPASACCHDKSLCVVIPCMASTPLLDKLASFKNQFTVTGAWPPTPDAHKPGSHDNGTAVDIVPTTGGLPALLNLAGKIKSAGAGYVQYESYRCSELTPYLSGIPCVANAKSSGEHFHVQLYASN